MEGMEPGVDESQTRVLELGVDEYEKREALDNLIDMFLRGLYDNFDLEFGTFVMLYEKEVKKLVAGYSSFKKTVNGDLFIVEYIYDYGALSCDDEESDVGKCEVMRKHLILRYHKEEECGIPLFFIDSISGKTEYTIEEKAA
jgi:hypothetical protein